MGNGYAGGYVSSEFPVFRAKPGLILEEFLYRYFCRPQAWKQIEHQSTGTTSVSRNRWKEEQFFSWHISLPPLHEQERIVAILCGVDEAIKDNEEVITRTWDLKKALAHELLTRGLPGRHSHFKDSPIGRIPAEWEVKRLGELLIRIKAGKSPKCEDHPAGPDEWGVLKVSAISSGHYLPQENKMLPSELTVTRAGGASWKDVDKIDGIRSIHIVSSLLKKSLVKKCIEKGLKLHRENRLVYFPQGLLEKDRIKYVAYKGRRTRLCVIGERRFASGRTHYHLALAFWVRQDVLDGFVAQVKIRLHLVGMRGQELETRLALGRRKKITKGWWNHEWLSRQIAIRSFLADGTDHILIGSVPEEQIVLATAPIQGGVPVAINEEFLKPLRAKLRAMQVEQADDDETDELVMEEY